MNLLPIIPRGKFSNDKFFDNFQKDFEDAMQNVFSRFGSGRSFLADELSAEGAEEGGGASISETPDCYVIILNMKDYVNGTITVKTRGQSAEVEASWKDKKFHKRFPLPRNTNLDGVTAAMSDEGILTIRAPKEQVPEVTGEDFSGAPKMDSGINDSSLVRDLAILKKGKFFQDSYFENVWKDFERSTTSETVERNASSSCEQQTQRIGAIPKFTRLNSYRHIRDWIPIDDTRASTVTRDQNGYKIVLDVQNFADLRIKASEGVVIVTGSADSLQFQKDFQVPGLVDQNQINGSLSQDGILTIIVTLRTAIT